jgi:WD40 repeat protein
MLDSAIRTISSAQCSPIAAAARFERKVQIWNFATAELVSELDTVFDSGGHRLSVDPSGEYCVAASFRAGQKGGVVCYEARSGRKVWHRADLRRVQGVRFSPTGETIWCRVEGGPIQTLDAHTGLTLGSLRKIREVFDSPFTTHLLHVPQGDYVIVNSAELRVPRITSAILDATFSPDALCLSEAATFRSEVGGPVRCLDLKTAEERWRYQPPLGSHVLRLSYQADQSFYGVQWSYQSGGPVMLIQLSQSTGAVRNVCNLNSLPDAFCFAHGNVLVSSGDVVSLPTGSIVRRTAFPMTDYPDPEATVEAGE